MEAYEQDRNVQWVSNKQEAEYSMRPVSETNISETINPKEEQGKVLQQSLSEQGVSVSGKASSNGGGEEPCLERGSNLQESKGELQGSDIPEVSKGVSTNGEEGRIYNATQTGDGSTSEQTIGESGGSSSPRPQSQQQQYREPCAFCKQYGTQAMGALGLGSALKPACEPITVARKPISEKNLADNHLKWGVGGINIDGCRVEYQSEADSNATLRANTPGSGRYKQTGGVNIVLPAIEENYDPSKGRFPANLIHDGSQEVLDLFPQTKSGSGIKKKATGTANGIFNINKIDGEYLNGDSGSAARFFYCAKASRAEREMGMEGQLDGQPIRWNKAGKWTNDTTPAKNNHPTVKPIKLMRYLCKLVTPPGGIILDPFMGSGSTGKAALMEGFRFIGIELEKEYTAIAEKRIMSAQPLFAGLER